jgi:hypothetical protein
VAVTSSVIASSWAAISSTGFGNHLIGSQVPDRGATRL